MSGWNSNVTPPKKGEVITADFLAQVTGNLNRVSKFFGRNVMVNGAGVFTRKVKSSSAAAGGISIFSLNADLHRTAVSSADLMQWDGSDFDTDTGEDYDLDGKFFRGYAFSGELVRAKWSQSAGKYFAVGSGHTWVRGTLEDTLSSGGTQTLNVQQWNGSAWESAGKTVTLRESIGLDTGVDANAVVGADWHENHGDLAGFWVPTNAACETT